MTAPVVHLRIVLRRIAIYAVGSAIVLLTLAYAADYCVFRIRTATHRQPVGSVTVTRYYAVLQKNGKTQFIFDSPAAQECSNTLFPEGGDPPCWYLQRHPEKRVNI